ncbi:hypothetical protein Emed_004915 [Eimeria media]
MSQPMVKRLRSRGGLGFKSILAAIASVAAVAFLISLCAATYLHAASLKLTTRRLSDGRPSDSPAGSAACGETNGNGSGEDPQENPQEEEPGPPPAKKAKKEKEGSEADDETDAQTQPSTSDQEGSPVAADGAAAASPVAHMSPDEITAAEGLMALWSALAAASQQQAQLPPPPQQQAQLPPVPQPQEQPAADQQPQAQPAAVPQPAAQPAAGQQPQLQPAGVQQPGAQPAADQQPQTQPLAGQQPQPQPAAVQQPQAQPAAVQQPQPQPAAGQQPGAQPAGVQQPQPQPAAGQQPGAQPAAVQQPQPQPAAVQQPGAQPAAVQQPGAQPAGVQQPQPQPAAGQQPGAQPAAVQQPQPQPAAGQQPGAQPAGVQQPQPQPAGVQQPGAQPAAVQQPGAQPACVQQPQPQPAAGQQPQPQPAAGQQPRPQPAGVQQPGAQPAAGQQPGAQPAGVQQPQPQPAAGQQPQPQPAAVQQQQAGYPPPHVLEASRRIHPPQIFTTSREQFAAQIEGLEVIDPREGWEPPGSTDSRGLPAVEHAFSRLPQVLGGNPSAFRSFFSAQRALSNAHVAPMSVYWVQQINSFLTMQALIPSQLRQLGLFAEHMASHLTYNEGGDLPSCPSYAVETLGFRFLVLDMLVSSLQLLGVPRSGPWWEQMTSRIADEYTRPFSRWSEDLPATNVHLMVRLTQAIRTLKSGQRPSPRVLVHLKRCLFCSSRSPLRFLKHGWDSWRAENRRYYLQFEGASGQSDPEQPGPSHQGSS